MHLSIFNFTNSFIYLAFIYLSINSFSCTFVTFETKFVPIKLTLIDLACFFPRQLITKKYHNITILMLIIMYITPNEGFKTKLLG